MRTASGATLARVLLIGAASTACASASGPSWLPSFLGGGEAAPVVTDEEGVVFLAQHALDPDVTVMPSGLQYKVLESGPADSTTPRDISRCTCNFKVTLIDGTIIDSTAQRGEPITLLPNRAHLKGWAAALKMMRAGDKWELAMPPMLAYGNNGQKANVPMGAVILIEVELLKVEEGMFTFFGIDWSQYATAIMITLFYIYRIFFYDDSPPKGPKLTVEEATRPEHPVVFLDIKVSPCCLRAHIYMYTPSTCAGTCPLHTCICRLHIHVRKTCSFCVRAHGRLARLLRGALNSSSSRHTFQRRQKTSALSAQVRRVAGLGSGSGAGVGLA